MELTEKLGPLPVWGWGLIVVGGAALVMRRGAMPAASPGPDEGAPGPASDRRHSRIPVVAGQSDQTDDGGGGESFDDYRGGPILISGSSLNESLGASGNPDVAGSSTLGTSSGGFAGGAFLGAGTAHGLLGAGRGGFATAPGQGPTGKPTR